MNMFFKKCFCAVTILLSVGMSTVTQADDSAIAKIKARGELIVATGNYRPFEYYDDNNKMVGYDIDIAQKIAEKLRVKLKVNDMQFTSLIPSVQSGHADIVIAAMYINDERKKVVDFSEPYLKTGMVLVVKKSNNAIAGPEDLKGLTVGAKAGATSEQVARKLSETTPFTIKAYQDTSAQTLDLTSGRIDAGINDLLNQMELNKVFDNVKVVGKPFTEASLGIAVKKGDTQLVSLVNSVINEMRASGELDALYNKWIIGK
ncbi:ABC transporter substrate-binding protein [Brenneria goodwinii]|uniref:ABC transporter substrate-binding protein n=1 Tax=Brenneria goodwinii TaxID=1109412 RepID=UPI0036EEAA7C